MAEADADRVTRETLEIEEIGGAWARRSDAFLVGYVAQNRPNQFHTPAIVEMQRRHMAAMKEYNEQTSAQTQHVVILAEKTERLTRLMLWLTVVVGVVAVLQLWAAIGGTSK